MTRPSGRTSGTAPRGGPVPGSGTPSDWVSGERVFAPPRGTVDVDWLVPAVLELTPGARPEQARAALERVWLARRERAGRARREGRAEPGEATSAGPVDPVEPVDAAAARVLTEALHVFGD